MDKKKTHKKGITLIALVITIILLLILAGITIHLTVGQRGILKRAEQAGESYYYAQAREKLELVLMELQSDKLMKAEYNEEYMENKLSENGIDLNGNIALVDGYTFEIDRSVPEIATRLEEDTHVMPEKVYLYGNGEEHPEIGGNWNTSQYGEPDHGELSKEADALLLTGKYCYGMNYIIGKEQLIDLTAYQFIHAKIEVVEVSDTHYNRNTNMCLLDRDGNKIENSTVVIRENANDNLGKGIETISLDLSKVNEKNAYIAFDSNSYAIKIYEVWLESKDIYAKISFDDAAIKIGEKFSITVQQNSITIMRASQCKYILTNQSEPYGTESSIWQNAETFSSLNQELQLQIEDTREYYLHVLSVNQQGDKIETVSNQIKRKQYLYRQNKDYSQVTGGWDFYVNGQNKISTNDQDSYSDAHGSYQITPRTLEINVIPVSVRGIGSYIEFKTKNTIDLTGYTTLKIKATTANMTDYQSIAVAQDNNFTVTSKLPNTSPFNETQNSLNISTLEGEYYIQFGMGSYLNATAKVEAIWLE